MMVNVIAGENGKPNPSELLDWLSDKLQSTYSQVKQTCTGSAFCQLMDLICPGTINIDEVKFKAKDDADILNNYNLLQVAFNKAQIKKKLDLKLLVDGDVLKILDLLTWFKVFFDDGEQRQMPSCTEAKEEEHSRRLHNVAESKSSNQNIKNAKKTTDANKDLDSLFCSPAIACFIRKYCYSTSVSDGSPLTHSKVRLVLGNKYPEDITAICSQTPYCLYLFHGVDIEEEKEANVVLLGFFDQASGENKIRLLDVFQQEEETADSIRTCIVEILKKFKIPLMNMALIYSNFPDPEGLLSGLRVLKPEIVSLCGLTDIAEQVCHSGVMGMEFSGQIQRLITDVYHHFPSFPPALKNLLVDTEGSDFSELLATQCSLFWRVVYKMTIAWSDLEQYFGCQDDRTDLKTTHLLLSDPKLRLNFVFLSDVLQPLSDFQESFDQGVNVTQLLQDAVQLLKFYTASFLRPGAAECFFRRGDTLLLKDTAVHLPRGEVKLGKQVASFLLQNAAELIDYLDSFHKSIISFYVTVTLVIVERLPFSDSTLRNLSLVLSPGKKLEVTGKVVQDLSTCFGICSSPEKVSLLTDEFLEYQFIDGSDTNVDDQSMEQYWKRELRIMGRTSLFGKLILSMLALPKTLKEEIIFEQVVGSQCEITDTVEDDITDSSSYKSAPSHPPTPETHDSITSDIIDLTEVEDIAPMEVEDIVSVSSESDTESKNAPKGHGAYVSVVLHDNDDGEITDDDDEITDDDDDYNNSEDNDVKWNNTANQRKRKGLSSTLNRKVKTNTPYQDGKGFLVGEMVWGQIEGFGLWPGLVQNWESEKLCDSRRKVMFFANAMTSEIPADDLLEYFSFARCFCSNSFATVTTYKDAIFHSLQVASQRSRMFFSPEVDFKDELLRVMLNWAFGGFQPSGPEGLQPQSKWNEEVFKPQPARVKGTAGISSQNNNYHSEKLFNLTICLNKLSESLDLRSGSVDLSKRGVYRKLMYPKSDAKPFQKVKTRRRKYVFRNKIQNNSQVKLRQNSHERHHMVHEVLVNGKSIKDFCLSCGSSSCEIFHPLFEGGLCFTCKDNFTETLYRYDEDGYQSYCTVCCSGMEVILCGHDSCCRSYCVDCLDILVGDGTFNKLKDVDPWICYLCAPENSYGALKPRHDWSISVQEFFANNSAMEFEPHRVYPSVPANLRRPIRVLSLFDGIATGYLVLRDLGFKVEKYVASEIDEESITVSMVNHDGKITHVDDVRKITKEHIEKWGPFDLLIGGSPCNDLSIVNPARKGLFEGTGRLFFEYYRLLNIMKPKEDDPQPFFWLFENVVFMNTRDKADICRFLECNPVLIDAVKVSPAHRARYFWGNLPGMNRPITASQNDKLSLQECLEAGRTAKFVKVRTITTRSNSLKQGNNDKHYPVTMQGKDDNIWITEMEKIFGFPKHYTDVKNMGRIQRHKVLGKSWSVPVIRHLFAPLKDYFACDEVPLK